MNGKSPSSKTIEGVIKLLRERNDIQDIESVVSEFKAQASILLDKLKNDLNHNI